VGLHVDARLKCGRSTRRSSRGRREGSPRSFWPAANRGTRRTRSICCRPGAFAAGLESPKTRGWPSRPGRAARLRARRQTGTLEDICAAVKRWPNRTAGHPRPRRGGEPDRADLGGRLRRRGPDRRPSYHAAQAVARRVGRTAPGADGPGRRTPGDEGAGRSSLPQACAFGNHQSPFGSAAEEAATAERRKAKRTGLM